MPLSRTLTTDTALPLFYLPPAPLASLTGVSLAVASRAGLPALPAGLSRIARLLRGGRGLSARLFVRWGRVCLLAGIELVRVIVTKCGRSRVRWCLA